MAEWVLDDAYKASFDEFIAADFEEIWKLAPELSDDEKSAFSGTTAEADSSMDSIVCGEDPVLTTAGLEELLPPPLDVSLPAEEEDCLEPEPVATTTAQWPEDHENKVVVVKEELPPLDYPIAIHSYSLPPSSEMLPGDEVHYKNSSTSEDDEDNTLVTPPPPSKASSSLKRKATVLVETPRRSCRQPKRQKKAVEAESSDDEENTPNSSSTMTVTDTFSNGKKKLYKSGPFKNNPDMERARLNAINAKRNRDRKKHEKAAMDAEMSRLRVENQGLRRANSHLRARMVQAEEELRQIREILRSNNLEAVLKAPGKC